MLYCTFLPTMGAATPSGVLRVLDRFDLISWQSTVTPISRVILVGIAYFVGAPFAVYVAIWYVTDLAGDLYLVSRLARASPARPARRDPADAEARPFPAPGVSQSTSISRQRPGGMGTDCPLVVGGFSGPAGAASVPRRVHASPRAQPSPPTSSARPSTPRSCDGPHHQEAMEAHAARGCTLRKARRYAEERRARWA